MIGRNELAEAVRYNDALSEEAGGEGLPAMLASLGIDVGGATYVAYQRALRGLVMVKGGDAETWGAIASVRGLTKEQQDILAALAGMFVDGLVAHARAAAVEGRDDG